MKPGCNFCDSCFEEYKYTMPACIRNQAPDCKAKAVIPSVTTQTVDGLTNLANCFVHVTDINTTFYVDDKHRPMIIWAGPVEVSDYDTEANELGLRSQFCFSDEVMYYFDKQGIAHRIGPEEV